MLPRRCRAHLRTSPTVIPVTSTSPDGAAEPTVTSGRAQRSEGPPLAAHSVPGDALVLPATGELVNLDDEVSCAQALESLRGLEAQIREAKAGLVRAIVSRSELLGSRTLPLGNGLKAVVKSGTVVEYDAEQIELGLRRAGMPEDRIRAVVEETVSYRVRAVEAKRAASANPAYGEIIERHTRTVQKPPSVSIER